MHLSLEEQIDALRSEVGRLKDEVELARDKQEIYDSMMLYCRGVDRCVPGLVTEMWPSQRLEVTKRITDWLHDNTGMTMHHVGNCLITVDGDYAESESYMISYHTYDVDGCEMLRVKAGRDLRTWRRTDDGWVTTDRDFRDDWNWFVEIQERAPGSDNWRYGVRGEGDPVFHYEETFRETLEQRRAQSASPSGYPGLHAWER